MTNLIKRFRILPKQLYILALEAVRYTRNLYPMRRNALTFHENVKAFILICEDGTILCEGKIIFPYSIRWEYGKLCIIQEW
jgi:hypothetical protein